VGSHGVPPGLPWECRAGQSYREGLTAPVREGVGLRHTRARLRALYGEAHVFDFRRREGGGVEVHLEVPWRPASTSRTA